MIPDHDLSCFLFLPLEKGLDPLVSLQIHRKLAYQIQNERITGGSFFGEEGGELGESGLEGPRRIFVQPLLISLVRGFAETAWILQKWDDLFQFRQGGRELRKSTDDHGVSEL